MKSSKFEIKRDKITLKGTVIANPTPKAKVVLVHGMAEQASRYTHFAENLAEAGFTIYFYDQRGHGKTAGSVEKVGFFAYEDGWNKVTEDLNSVVDYAISEGDNLPLFLFGHSMGSFVSRNFTSIYGSKIHGLILSGTAGSAGILAFGGLLVSKIIMMFNDKTTPSPLLDKLSFGDFNKKFKPNRTTHDWLSRDKNKVDKYVGDPYCGVICSAGFFNDMIHGLEDVNKIKHANKFRSDLPVHLLSGDADPVSKNGKQIIAVAEMYKAAGIKDLTYKLYPGGRHEMLNETNKEEVYSDVIKWINSKL